MPLQELFVQLGFKMDSKGMKALSGMVSKLNIALEALRILISVTVKATIAIFAFTVTFAGIVDRLGKAAERLRIPVAVLDALRFAAELATGSANGLESAIERLLRTASQAQRGMGPGVEAFAFLNVDPAQVKDPIALIKAVADGLQGFERARQLELAEQLGLGQFILLLDRGSAGIQDLIDQANLAGNVTNEQARTAAKLNEQLRVLFRRLVRDLSVILAMGVAPTITAIVEEINNWVKANRALIQSNLTGAIALLSAFLKTLWYFLKPVLRIFESLSRIAGKIAGLFKRVAQEVKGLGQDLEEAFGGQFWDNPFSLGGMLDFLSMFIEELFALVDPKKVGALELALHKFMQIFAFMAPVFDAMNAVLDRVDEISAFVAELIDQAEAIWNRMRDSLPGGRGGIVERALSAGATGLTHSPLLYLIQSANQFSNNSFEQVGMTGTSALAVQRQYQNQQRERASVLQAAFAAQFNNTINMPPMQKGVISSKSELETVFGRAMERTADYWAATIKQTLKEQGF